MFDLLFLLVVGLSTAFAAMRGGLREFATLLALAIAGGLTWVIAPGLLTTTGLSGSFFGSIILAAVLIAAFFVVVHIGLHLVLKRTPLEGRAALIDRASGGAFGLFRGLVLVGLGFLGYGYYLDEARQPDSVKNAITRPVAAGMASWFESFAPEDAYIENTGDTPEEETNAAVDGYARSDRNGLEEIVTTVTTTDPTISETGPEPIEANAEDTSLEDSIADILIEEDQ